MSLTDDEAQILELFKKVAAGPDTNGDGTHEEPEVEGAVSGATFLLDQDASLIPWWGRDNEVLWAKGESLFIVGPPGVGKSTLSHQVVAALLGLRDEVLGYPVLPAKKVLLLAMDRPSQIRRAMRRLLGEDQRKVLEDRLVVWPRPLPGDLGKKPEILVQLAKRLGCDVVILDSVKDAVGKLTGDEEANSFNRSLQLCLADGVDVLALHHQRKGQGGAKPTTLEDVYGSIWLVAGAGSVVLLWGEAGSELIELSHLKQPADPVGPLKLEHDHHVASTTVSHQWNAYAYLTMRGIHGATTVEAAQAEHGIADVSDAKRKKTERKLRSLEQRGKARHEAQGRGDEGRMASTRWWAVDVSFTVDTTVDTFYESAGQTVDTPSDQDGTVDTVDTFYESAGQTVDTTVDNRGHPHRGHMGAFIRKAPMSTEPDPEEPPESASEPTFNEVW